MMSTEECRQVLEGELNFTRSLNELRRDIQSIKEKNDGGNLPPKPTNRKNLGGLQAMQALATQAVNATAISGLIERFLSTVTLPVIQGDIFNFHL